MENNPLPPNPNDPNQNDPNLDLNQPMEVVAPAVIILAFLIAEKYLNVKAVGRMLVRAFSEFGNVQVEAIRDNKTFVITTDSQVAGNQIVEGGP